MVRKGDRSGIPPIKNPDRDAEILFLPSNLLSSLLVGFSDRETVHKSVRHRFLLFGLANVATTFQVTVLLPLRHTHLERTLKKRLGRPDCPLRSFDNDLEPCTRASRMVCFT